MVATGTDPLSYQWQKNGTAIAGATAASYTTPPLQIGDDGRIREGWESADFLSFVLQTGAQFGPPPSE